ncbi:MAG: GNAT family N-acetyltransferase [Clostridia bacterium]|nr:GNAT family N-acetyltransferase [Clostridia bacterium]
MEQNTGTVQYTTNVSKQALEDLWVTCFPEDASGFARFFLETYFCPEQGVCVVQDGMVQSALYMLPCTYRVGDSTGTLLYIYAMCTHPDHRRKGNLRRMLAFAEQHCMAHGIDGLILHALDTSKSVVEAFGMTPVLTLGEEHFTRPAPAATWEPCGSFETFRNLRTAHLEKMHGAVSWGEKELRLVYEDLRRNSQLVFFRDGEDLHYGVVSCLPGGWKIEETDCLAGLLLRLSGDISLCTSGAGVYGAHGKFYKKSLQEEACKLYFNLMMQ